MLYLSILASLLALFFAYFLIRERYSSNLAKRGQGEPSAYQEARTFLKKQYWAIGKWAVFLFFVFLIGLGWKEAGGFLLGVIFSGLNAIIIGFLILGREKNPAPSFRLAIAGGFFSGGLGLLAVSLCYFFFGSLRPLIALGIGSSLFSLFLHLGRDGPATRFSEKIKPLILSVDIFETYVLTNLVCIVLGGLLFFHSSFAPLFPLLFTTCALLSSMISVALVYLWKRRSPIFRLVAGFFLSVFLSGLGFLLLIIKAGRVFGISEWRLAISCLIALFGTIFIFLISFRFNLKDREEKGFFFLPKSGFSFALADLSNRALFAIFLILDGLLIILPAYFISGVYGLSIAAISAVSLSPLIVAFNLYLFTAAGAFGRMDDKGEIRFFPGGMAGVQGFAILGAGFSGILLYFAYIQQLARLGAKVPFFLDRPSVLTGLFLAPLIAYCFFYLLSRTSLSHLTQGAFYPSILFLPVVPLLVGLVLGAGALAGLLIGSILVWFFLACFIGPSVNPMIKVLGIVSLLLAACFLVY